MLVMCVKCVAQSSTWQSALSKCILIWLPTSFLIVVNILDEFIKEIAIYRI